MKNSYTAAGADYPKYGTILADMTIDMAVVAAIATTTSVVIAGTTSGLLLGSLTGALALFTQSSIASASLALHTSFALSGVTVSNAGVIGAAAGPVSAVLIGLAIGVIAAMQVFDHEASVNQLKSLQTSLTAVTNTPPDLKSFISDSTGLGLFKIQAVIASQTTGDVPSTKELPAHRDGIDAVFLSEAITQVPFTYRDWDQNIWTAHLWGGWIVQTCAKGPTSTKACSQTDSITADIRYRQPRQPAPVRLKHSTGLRRGLATTSSTPGECSGAATTNSHARPTPPRVRALNRTSRNVRPTSRPRSVTWTAMDLFRGPFWSSSRTPSSPPRRIFRSPPAYRPRHTVTATGNPKSNVLVADNGGTLTANTDFTITPAIGTPDFNTLRIAFNGNPDGPRRRTIR